MKLQREEGVYHFTLDLDGMYEPTQGKYPSMPMLYEPRDRSLDELFSPTGETYEPLDGDDFDNRNINDFQERLNQIM